MVRYAPRWGSTQTVSRHYENKPSLSLFLAHRGGISRRLTVWSMPGWCTLSHLASISLRSLSIELQLTLSYLGTFRLRTSGKPPNEGSLHVALTEVHFLLGKGKEGRNRRKEGKYLFVSFRFSLFSCSYRDIIFKSTYFCARGDLKVIE